MSGHLPAEDELAVAIAYFAKHDEVGASHMTFINNSTLKATLAFLRELQMRRIQMQQLAADVTTTPTEQKK